MDKAEIQLALDEVADCTGFQLQAETDFELKNQEILVRFVGSENHNSLFFEVQRTPLVWHLKTRFDTFSRPLVLSLVEASRASEKWLEAELSRLRNDGFGVTFVVPRPDATLDPTTDETLEFELQSIVDIDSRGLTPGSEVGPLAGLLKAAVVIISSLAGGLSSNEKGDSQINFGDLEGNSNTVVCSRYERSARNRAGCLEHYGFICAACGLKPEEMYGALGRRIIHIHHLTPLSEMPSPSVVDPIKDLRPLCPNCHNYAHKRTPPFSPEEISSAVIETRSLRGEGSRR